MTVSVLNMLTLILPKVTMQGMQNPNNFCIPPDNCMTPLDLPFTALYMNFMAKVYRETSTSCGL